MGIMELKIGKAWTKGRWPTKRVDCGLLRRRVLRTWFCAGEESDDDIHLSDSGNSADSASHSLR